MLSSFRNILLSYFLSRTKVALPNRGATRSLCQVAGEAVNRVNLFRWLVQLINDVGEQTARGSQHAISHVYRKFSVEFLFGNFISTAKRKKISYILEDF